MIALISTKRDFSVSPQWLKSRCYKFVLTTIVLTNISRAFSVYGSSFLNKLRFVIFIFSAIASRSGSRFKGELSGLMPPRFSVRRALLSSMYSLKSSILDFENVILDKVRDLSSDLIDPAPYTKLSFKESGRSITNSSSATLSVNPFTESKANSIRW